MAANEQFDIMLGGNGYMLARDPKTRGRAWQRTGVGDSIATARRQVRAVYGSDENYGGLPADIDAPLVWDDWSGGWGDYVQHKGRENHYHVAYNWDARFPGILLHAQQPQKPNPAASFGQNANYVLDVPLAVASGNAGVPPAGAGTVLVLGQGYVQRWTPSTAPNVFDIASEATGGGLAFGYRAQVFGSFTYIPNLAGSGFYRRPHDGLAYTQSDCMTARWFEVAGGRLWRGWGRGYLQSCSIGADPMVTANWSATVQLGDGNMVSQDAKAFESNLFVGFPDGLYQGNQNGTFNNILTDVGEYVSSDSIQDITVHNGGLVTTDGANIWWYKPAVGANSALRQIWPNVEARATATITTGLPGNFQCLSLRGKITCVTGYGRWLYAGVFNGSLSAVFCGWAASQDLPYVWHPMQVFAESVKIRRIHIDGITANSAGNPVNQRIWVATDASYGALAAGTAPLYMWPIPRGDDNPLLDLTFSPNYCSNSYMELPITNADAPGTPKLLRKLEMTSETFGGGVYMNAQVDATMNADMIRRGYIAAPKDVNYFTNNNSTAIAQQAQVQIAGQIGAGQNAPIVRSMVLRTTLRPRSNDTITARLTVADGARDRQGNAMRSGQTQMGELRTMMKDSNPVQLVDLVGATLPVVVLPPVEESESYQQGSDDPQLIATVKVGVMDASWLTFAPVAPT